MGPQIIWWAKIGPVDGSFHGYSGKMVSGCKAMNAMTHIMKSTSALIIQSLQKSTKPTIF